MDGFMSKDIHAIGIKRKREYSPSRRESDYKGSSLGPYRGAGNAVTPNGTKVDSHDYYRPEKYIPTGPRTLGRERYRGTESRKSSAFEAPTIEQRVSTSRRTPSPQEGHDGNAQQRPRATEVMEKTSKLVPTDTASNRVERKSFSSICSLDTQANYLKKSVSLTKEAGYNSINALKKDKIVENLQWEYAKRDKFSPIESVSTADDERNRDPPLPRSKSYSKKNKEGPFDLPFDAEQNVTSSRQITGIETIDKKKHSGHMRLVQYGIAVLYQPQQCLSRAEVVLRAVLRAILYEAPFAVPFGVLYRVKSVTLHDYHTHCHNPKITMTSGKLIMDMFKMYQKRFTVSKDNNCGHEASWGFGYTKIWVQNSSMVAPAPSSDTESAVMPEDSAKRKLLPGTQVVPANGAKLLDSQTIIQDCQSNENLSSPISQEAGGNIDKTTVPDDQMVKVLHVSPKTLGHDLRIPIKSRHPDSIQPPINEHDLIGEADDEEAPMDLDSDAGISRPCSPVGEHHTSEPINAATNKPHGISLSSGSHDNSRNLHDDNKTQAPLVHKSNISDNMASEDSSPPYSPRLECDSLPDFPTTETPGKPTERESIGTLVSNTNARSVAIVSAIFTTPIGNDASNIRTYYQRSMHQLPGSTNCLLQYQALAGKSPKAAKITRPKINTANHQSTVDNTETPPELPQRRIKTRQELVEEKYQMQKEIFLPSLRIPQNKDIGKLIEEKTASAATVSIREKAENKEGPKKKLTIEEYTMKKKEKEKGVNPKATAISTDNEEVGKNSDNPGSKKSQEPLPVPDNELTKSTTESRDNGSLKPRPVAATADQATKIPVERGQALHDEEKLKQEVVLWKKKFEEQKGFVQNYVRHNNKMMDKLAEAEKRASELQKMIAALEAKNQASEIKQSQLEAENEDLKQQRVRQEEEQSQCVATEKAEVAIGASKTSELADLMEKNDSAEKDAGVVLLKDVYNHLTFDIDDPLRDMIGAPPSITAPAVLPTPRYSLSRKSEVLNFNSTNLYKLHLHREIDRGTTSVTGFAVVTSEKAARGNTTSAETVEGKTMTFEEFARIPQNLVPVVKDGVLAFRNGQLHPRTRRLERNVPHYKASLEAFDDDIPLPHAPVAYTTCISPFVICIRV
ncbi:hypothetical protein BDZ91DRAFT_758958 [Kalaharituber pfeilii]|nr:hypothetical protein BDZ91DRAFT_758958 [Kalaharituber pfeilii]